MSELTVDLSSYAFSGKENPELKDFSNLTENIICL